MLIIFFYLTLLFSFIKIIPSQLFIFNNNSIKLDLIDKYLDKEFNLQQINYSCDFDFDKREFDYLVDLQPGKCTTDKIKNACFYLKEKNRFETISLETEHGLKGQILTFNLSGSYGLSKVKIKNLIFNNQKFSKLYLIEKGEKFNNEKHLKSIELIKKFLHNKGYFSCTIDSNFKLNKNNKTISVSLYINKGKFYPINDVKFVFADKQIILNNLIKRSFKKPKYSLKLLTQEINNLKKYLKSLGYHFCEVKIKKIINNNAIDLILKITLNQQILFKIQGNKFFRKKYLIEKLIRKNLNQIWIKEQILKIYKQSGFFDVSVNVNKKENVFFIDIIETKRSKLAKIQILENKFLTKKYIINKYFQNILYKPVCFHKIEKTLNKLTDYYQKNGFWEIEIKKNLNFIKNNKYELIINLHENNQKLIKSINSNNQYFNDYFKIKSSRPFDISLLSLQYKVIQNYLTSLNYKIVKIEPKLEEKDNLFSIFWQIDYSQSDAKLGKIITQNSNVAFKNTLKEFDSFGRKISKESIENAYNNLKELQIFESINIQPSSNYDFENKKPLIVKLKEEDRYELKARLGYQQVSRNLKLKGLGTYKAGGSFIVKNPFNICDEFKLNVDLSKFQQLFSAQYKLPWLFVIPFRTTFQIFLNKYYQPLYIGSDKNIYQVSDTGGFINFNKKNNLYNFSMNIGFDSLKIFDLSTQLAKAIYFSTNLIDERVTYFALEPTLFLEKLDDKINPTKGMLTVLYLKLMLSLQNSNDYFLKFLLEQCFYHNLFSPMVVALRFRFGHIFANDFSHLLPPIRFYLGGPNSIRSYLPDFAPPYGKCTDDNHQLFVPQGGRTMFNANFELRIPAFNALWLVLFQDIGYLFKGDDFKAKDLLWATGFGIRYLTAIGPLRFDIGWRKRHHMRDSNFAWFLTLGHAF